PTLAQTSNYAARALVMQESWGVLIDRGMKTLMHDIAKQPYYIKDSSVGFSSGLIADWFDQNWGELDPNHPGDRRVINDRINSNGPTLNSGLRVDKKEPDPRPNGGQGLFYNYGPKKPADDKKNEKKDK